MFNQSHLPTGHLFDGTAPDAVDQLAALILSELTPPWMRWFDLSAGTDLSPAERDRIAPELDKISETMQLHFDRSNFALEIHQCYFDLITAGTACLLFEEAPVGCTSAFRFTAVPAFDVCQRVAVRAIKGLLPDKTKGATHYHTLSANPKWASALVPNVQIGHHLFYTCI